MTNGAITRGRMRSVAAVMAVGALKTVYSLSLEHTIFQTDREERTCRDAGLTACHSMMQKHHEWARQSNIDFFIMPWSGVGESEPAVCAMHAA